VQAVVGEQGAHAPALAFAYVPTGHVVAVKAQVVEPWGLKDPAAQGRQTEVELAPGVVEYVPAEQGVHVELRAAPGVAL